MNDVELTARLNIAQKRFRELQNEQEDIYQNLLLVLNETDEPHMWIWDFLANDDRKASEAIEHLKKIL